MDMDTDDDSTTEMRLNIMKITVPGRTPMERLSNLTKRVIAVPKDEIEREGQKWQHKRTTGRRRKKTA
jgi:hypothetical protein